MHRDLQSRKDVRERAWALDGWSETVSKVRRHLPRSGMMVSLRVVVGAAVCPDRRVLDAHGRDRPGAPAVQPPQVALAAESKTLRPDEPRTERMYYMLARASVQGGHQRLISLRGRCMCACYCRKRLSADLARGGRQWSSSATNQRGRRRAIPAAPSIYIRLRLRAGYL